jgi:hypothetical protein
MQVTIKNNISYDFGDYTIMVNDQKVGVLLSNEKEKTIELPNSVPSEIFLRLNMLPTSNKLKLTSDDTTCIIVRRNIPINILGYVSMITFFIVLGASELTEFFLGWFVILLLLFAVAFLSGWKKLEIA